MTRRIRFIMFIAVVFTSILVLGSGNTPLVAPQAASAQGTACTTGLWEAQYYPNTTLTPTGTQQPICITQNQLNTGINWGTGSPLTGVIGTDFWSGVFQEQVTLATPGAYTFTSTYQDGIRLFVNGQLVINAYTTDLNAAQTATGSYTTTIANQVVTVRLEYVNYTGVAQVSLNWSQTGTAGPTGQPWTAEYFNNRTFTAPAIIGPNIPAGPLAIDWQFAAPVAGVNADGFSSRFTRVVNFPTGGVVTFEARGDDTVTVRVNGSAVTASAPFFAGEGVIYRGSITVPVGQSTIVVEHTDIVDQAYVFVNWAGGGDTSGGGVTQPDPGTVPGPGTPGVPGVPPPPIVTSPTGVVATVDTSVLNFRNIPSTTGQRLTQIRRGEQYAALGQSVGGDWVYLDVGGTRGWSFATFLNFSGDFSSLPVLAANGEPVVVDTSGNVVLQARPVGNMRIRECPSFSCTRLGFVPWGDVVAVFGQSFDGRWIRISYASPTGTITGWTSKIWYRPVGDLESPLPSNLPIVE